MGFTCICVVGYKIYRGVSARWGQQSPVTLYLIPPSLPYGHTAATVASDRVQWIMEMVVGKPQQMSSLLDESSK